MRTQFAPAIELQASAALDDLDLLGPSPTTAYNLNGDEINELPPPKPYYFDQKPKNKRLSIMQNVWDEEPNIETLVLNAESPTKLIGCKAGLFDSRSSHNLIIGNRVLSTALESGAGTNAGKVADRVAEFEAILSGF